MLANIIWILFSIYIGMPTSDLYERIFISFGLVKALAKSPTKQMSQELYKPTAVAAQHEKNNKQRFFTSPHTNDDESW